ncbi:hypothetical protein ERICIV_04558 (plasmid) [Paenibacillus larvae subsp. larvae]|uniref:Uncharacterized protein n=1 Tax=Paenibacillus larvae subsp. larvae TaxID=147375 RepID=A0A2L1U7P1_9BACL|nr:hypothetical protein [Paenibacillus larvae]AVF28940.1 hypothetical protein ERICIII_04938 [Paenibacillus larvae subsp. larvae]AVF33322.1 hypothetical protein ERICIV_04558 [Paenibacillus larvae subsp. larvae]MCY7520793.1 hypothetical protein [Paenibacillus larvae]MCY9503123.1 hypothetical protein [Paenibacillus larvae]MCY9677963.1 hypothetical protein [Paenibacillus larvae]
MNEKDIRKALEEIGIDINQPISASSTIDSNGKPELTVAIQGKGNPFLE